MLEEKSNLGLPHNAPMKFVLPTKFECTHLIQGGENLNIQSNTHQVEVEPGVTLFVLEKFIPKEGKAPAGKAILCLPGAGVDHHSFDCPIGDYSLLDFLARQGYRAFGVDFRGFGQSTKPADGKAVTADLCLVDTIKVMDYIGETAGCERVSLLGISFGALVASMVAEREPARVDKVVLSGFFYANLNPIAMQMLTPEAMQAMAAAPNGYMPALPDLLRACMPTAEPEIVDWNLATFSYDVPNGPMLSAATLPLVQDPARITAPVLIVNGAQEIFATEGDSQAFIEKVSSPVQEVHWLPEAGHVPFFDRDYQKFQQLVADFL